MADTVTMKMSHEHARVVRDACELFMRMKMGQGRYATETLLGFPPRGGVEEYVLRRNIADDIMMAFLRAVGIYEGEPKDDDTKLAYETWAAIRHAEYLSEEHEPGDWDVRKGKPICESGLGVPEVKIE